VTALSVLVVGGVFAAAGSAAAVYPPSPRVSCGPAYDVDIRDVKIFNLHEDADAYAAAERYADLVQVRFIWQGLGFSALVPLENLDAVRQRTAADPTVIHIEDMKRASMYGDERPFGGPLWPPEAGTGPTFPRATVIGDPLYSPTVNTERPRTVAARCRGPE
jgi:hypothetical protein